MNKINFYITFALLYFFFGSATTFACTDFRLTAKDGTVLINRSMEFALDLHSNLMTAPRGQIISNTAPNGKPGKNWTTQYGYLFLDGLDTGVALDGMNEQGLSVEALYLPGMTEYQTVPDGKENQAIAYFHFGDWVLGNFKTVDEVKQALSTVFIFAQTIPQAKDMIFPLHFNIADRSGKAIVVEFIAGKMQVYDNLLGVMTNAPGYDWHLTNLRNYVNLSPVNPEPVIDSGVTFAATGQGAGMLGLPGDISPPSRFIRIAVLLKTVFAPANAVEAVNLAQHIMNDVDIPLGFVRSSQDLNTATNESTEWVVFKDLTHQVLYYRTYHDLTLRKVELSKLNFNQGAAQIKMPIDGVPYVMDVTAAFLKTEVKK